MPSITGAYEPPFDRSDRPPTWLVPLASLNHRPTTMLVICKACQHKRRWPVGELVERYGRRRMVQDLWVRWRCSRCGSADCLPCVVDPARRRRQYSGEGMTMARNQAVAACDRELFVLYARADDYFERGNNGGGDFMAAMDASREIDAH